MADGAIEQQQTAGPRADRDLRVTGKSRDDLQAAMALLRKAELDRPVQFNNFRD